MFVHCLLGPPNSWPLDSPWEPPSFPHFHFQLASEPFVAASTKGNIENIQKPSKAFYSNATHSLITSITLFLAYSKQRDSLSVPPVGIAFAASVAGCHILPG